MTREQGPASGVWPFTNRVHVCIPPRSNVLEEKSGGLCAEVELAQRLHGLLQGATLAAVLLEACEQAGQATRGLLQGRTQLFRFVEQLLEGPAALAGRGDVDGVAVQLR